MGNCSCCATPGTPINSPLEVLDYTLQADWASKMMKMQSPVNIEIENVGPGESNLRFFTYKYHLKPRLEFREGVMVLNFYDEHEQVVQMNSVSEIVVDSKSYLLDKIHFHVGSEHTFSEHQGVLECHMIHKSTSGLLVCVAVIFKVGSEHPLFATTEVPQPINIHHTVTGKISSTVTSIRHPMDIWFGKTRGQGGSYFQYFGSTTTPPCEEGVMWIISTRVVELSAAQLESWKSFARMFPNLKDDYGNYRQVQPLNGRKIYKVSESKQ